MKVCGTLARYLIYGAIGTMSMSCVAISRIPAGDKGLVYTGRIDFSVADAPQLSWPGSSIHANFEGSYLAIELDDQFGNNYFNVFIDNDFSRPRVIRAQQGVGIYVLAEKLAPGPHRFLLTKRTEGEDGATTVRHLELSDEGRLLPPSPRPTRRIEFFGDSITSGMGNESADDGPDDLPADKNNFMAYDAIVARDLDAELHVTSQSGIGIMVSWLPFTMPQFYSQLNAVGKNETRWDFSSWTPQVVVINLFQNDRWLIEREHRLKPEPTDQQLIQAYAEFVRSVRKQYPEAFIVCALGDMDATEPGSKWPSYVMRAVAQMKQYQGDTKIDTFFFEYSGFGAHPRLRHHQAMADQLTAFIRKKLRW